MICLGCFSMLLVAAWLSPSREGHGTHTQLGLSSCDWEAATGRPCPTCGMTTSFAHAAEGEFAQAAAVQPFGALLSLGVAAAFWVSLHVALTGSRAGRMFLVLTRPRTLILLLALGFAAWMYKMAVW